MFNTSTPTPVLASNMRTPPGTPDPTMIQTPVLSSTPVFMLDNATVDVLDLMDTTQLRQFILDARPSSATVSGATTPSVNFLLSFSSSPSSSTPQIDRVRRSITSVGMTTGLGSLDFLDSQANLDSVFGQHPVIIQVSKRNVGTCAIEDTECLVTRLAKYCELFRLHLFCSIIELHCFGTKTYDTHRMMHAIYLELSGLKLNFVHN